MNVCQRFIEGLKTYNLTHEEIKSWKFIGGTGGKHQRHDKYFKLKFKDDIFEFIPPKESKYCICRPAIVEQCWIVDETCLINKTIKDILIIGNCCKRHVLPDCGKNCGNCGAPHKNRAIDRCNDCKFKCDKCLGKKEVLSELLCYDCKTTKCESCDRTIKFNFMHCYKCYQKLQKQDNTKQQPETDKPNSNMT